MKRFISLLVPQWLKNIYHLACAILANVYFGFPAKKLRIIGITGTNGKTTTTQMIGAILREAGKKTAVASTIDFWMGDEQRINTSKFTTTSAWSLQKFLREAIQNGCEYAVIETSSHALDQSRVFGIPYEIAVMTNVTREHLDYHHTMEEYRKAKRKLFSQAQYAVINADMEVPEYFGEAISKKENVFFYSTKNKDVFVYGASIRLNFSHTEFMVEQDEYTLHIPGFFNIENALAAIATARILKIDSEVTRKALKQMTGIPGRMECLESKEGVDIIIDYAVTPDAFEKLYASVRPLKIPGTKIIHVFGACGDRDRGKRPILGSIASEYADVVILTNEDPYFEDGEQILNEIEAGISRKRGNEYIRIYDRREAIAKAIELAEQGDIILITGKGAETSMAIGEKRIPWSERQVIEEELAKKE
ncbi:MAG: UDP-N-acetylmuramoyl-L-alanyl-D-glutamate--2,6-diaminopimelate ligase [Candidatus Moranbacteria bacterium]|nr:UDP-N-acetylmuramoyl-L-alanyl-D-glutamate--2,6-diaminopimelate ligase [Candidatus Moranbacteria bacterium]